MNVEITESDRTIYTSADIISECSTDDGEVFGDLNYIPWGHENSILEMLQDNPGTEWVQTDEMEWATRGLDEHPEYSVFVVVFAITNAEPVWIIEATAEKYLIAEEKIDLLQYV